MCPAVNIAVKPQDTGLVWLYFLLAGRVYCQRALQTLLTTIVISVPAIIWVWYVSPHWIQELHANVMAFAVHSGLNDPGPASTGVHGLGMVISLQAVISVFWDDPRIYNPASYLVFAPLIMIWVLAIPQSRPSPERAWLAVAAIAAFSMLPIYHLQYDAKLILLTVPACAMLWAEGGLTGRLALLINILAFVMTCDLPWSIFLGIIARLHLSGSALSNQIVTVVQVFPAPLTLLATGIFYLWVYARRCYEPVPSLV